MISNVKKAMEYLRQCERMNQRSYLLDIYGHTKTLLMAQKK